MLDISTLILIIVEFASLKHLTPTEILKNCQSKNTLGSSYGHSEHIFPMTYHTLGNCMLKFVLMKFHWSCGFEEFVKSAVTQQFKQLMNSTFIWRYVSFFLISRLIRTAIVCLTNLFQGMDILWGFIMVIWNKQTWDRHHFLCLTKSPFLWITTELLTSTQLTAALSLEVRYNNLSKSILALPYTLRKGSVSSFYSFHSSTGHLVEVRRVKVGILQFYLFLLLRLTVH